MKQELGIRIIGRVVHGDHYGKKLGFPTANLDRRDYAKKRMKIRLGVWAGEAALPSKKKYRAAIVIGPLDKHHLPKLEAHLLGFEGNLYGQKITIRLQKYLRPFKKFSSELKLQQQIKQDIIKLKQILK